jgi:hypothetical protein
MEYIYIMSCRRSQGASEIHSVWDSYGRAIKEYYNYLIRDKKIRKDSDEILFMYLYEIPVNKMFAGKDDRSDEKFTKTSKHRIKFKNFGELKKEYQIMERDNKINEILS